MTNACDAREKARRLYAERHATRPTHPIDAARDLTEPVFVVRTFFVPQIRLQELLDSGDSLGANCLLSLGGLVTKRLREAVNRERELHSVPSSSARSSMANVVDDDQTNDTAVVSRGLRDTLIGAALTASEIDTLSSWGKSRSVGSCAEVPPASDAAAAVVVVGPALAASFAWVWGFVRKPR